MEKITLEEKIKSWLQIFAIIGAATWAIYTFVYQEIIKPKYLPSHIISSLELSSIGVCNSKIGIKAAINIENNSERKIFVLPSSFAVWGSKSELTNDIKNEDKFFKTAENIIIDTGEGVYNYHGFKINRQPVAIGPILGTYILEPGEKIRKIVVFYIPDNEYEFIEMNCYFPLSDDNLNIYASEWSVYKNNDAYEVSFISKNEDNKDNIIYRKDELLEKQNFGVVKINNIFSLMDKNSSM